jgi:hypothetical protein
LGFKAAPQSSHHLKTVYQFSIAAVYQFTTAADSIYARSDTELAIAAAKQAAEGYATAVAISESDR